MPGRHADPVLAVGAPETCSPGREPVKVRRVQVGMAGEARAVGIVLVREQEQHVRPAVGARLPADGSEQGEGGATRGGVRITGGMPRLMAYASL